MRMVWNGTGQWDGTTTEQAEKVKAIGIESVVRGKKPKTKIPDKALPCPLDNGEPPIPCASAKRALGQRLHLCRDMARLCVCGLRHQCLCTADCWLARQPHRECTLRVGRVGTGHSSTHASARPTGASPGSRIAISVDQIH